MQAPVTIKAQTLNAHKHPAKQLTIGNLGDHFQSFYNGTSPKSSTFQSPNIYSGLRSDFCRLGRRLLNKSIGLVLGGGGARGIAHVGIIRAFEEVGIPIDMVGGTSIGSFVGGAYARENDHVSVFARTKQFCQRVTSTWRLLLDLTYPVVAMTTGIRQLIRS
jgi:predicted acylesterase/phospholipase RssA